MTHVRVKKMATYTLDFFDRIESVKSKNNKPRVLMVWVKRNC